MFDNNKYATCGIISNIPSYLQNILWYMIESMDIHKKDYLQVFELSQSTHDSNTMQKIIHKQENPDYIKEHIIPVKSPVTVKIFVIDDGSHSTMLLAEEY